jgi:hypothetical protein
VYQALKWPHPLDNRQRLTKLRRISMLASVRSFSNRPGPLVGAFHEEGSRLSAGHGNQVSSDPISTTISTLPAEVIEQTAAKYGEAMQRLLG